MPRVPGNPDYTPYPDQGPSNIPSPELRRTVLPETFGVNLGQAVESLGGSVAHAGDELFNRAIAIQDLQNETDASNKNAEYMIQTGELHAKFNALEGNDRVQAAPQYFKNLQDLRNKMRGDLPSNNARRMFDRQSLGTMGHTIFNGAGAAATAQKQYADNTAKAEIEENLKIMEGMPTDDVLFQNKLNRNRELAGKLNAIQGGIPGDANERMLIAKNESAAWTRRITSIARSGEPQKAWDMNLANSNKILDTDQAKLDVTLRSEIRSVESSNIADSVYQDGRETPTKPPASLAEMQDDARRRAEKVSKDPIVAQHAVAGVTSRYNQGKYADKQEQQENEQTVAGAIMQLHPRDERDLRTRGGVKVQSALDALPETKRLGVAAQINRFNDAFNKRDNEAEHIRLNGMKNGSEGGLEEYLNLDMTQQNLSASQIIYHQNQQAKLQKQPLQDPRVTGALRAMRQARGSELEALKIYNRADDKTAYDHYAGAMQAGIQEWMDAHGKKPPSSKDIVDTIGPQVLRQRTEPGSWFGNMWTTKRPFYEQDVPDNFKKQLDTDLGEKGLEPSTDEEAYHAYQRDLFRKLYSKPKTSPK